MTVQANRKKTMFSNFVLIDSDNENIDTKEEQSIIAEFYDESDINKCDWSTYSCSTAEFYIDTIEEQCESSDVGSEFAYMGSQSTVIMYQAFISTNQHLSVDSTEVLDFEDVVYELVKNNLETIKSSIEEDIVLSGEDAEYFLNLLNNPDQERIEIRKNTLERASKIRKKYSIEDTG